MWRRVTTCLLAAMVTSCHPRESSSTSKVQAVLMGTFSKAVKRLQRDDPHRVVLLDVTGEADSLLLLTPENGCGFSAWSANSQSGPVGVEGRTGESFDLAHPRTWASVGTGLRDGCAGGAINSAEAYFYFLDFHLAVNSSSLEDTVVRVYTSESGGAKFGDLQVRDGDGVFKWVDTLAGDALVAARPAQPATYSISDSHGPLTVPWFDDNGARKMVMTKLPLSVVQTTRTVTPLTRKVVFDANFENVGFTATDKSSLAKIARTLSMPFLTNVQSPSTQILATVTPLTVDEIDGPNDPAPGDGNGQIQPARDGGAPDGGSPDAGP